MRICPLFYLSKAGKKPALITLVLFLLAFFLMNTYWPWLVLFLITIFLFRDSNKELSNPDEKAILSPIAGKIIAFDNIEYNTLGKCVEIKLANSILNQGTLRALKDAKITKTIYKHGNFFCPCMKAAKSLNERVIYICNNQGFDFALRVQAGVFGRKLKLYTKGDSFYAGEDLGFLLDARVSIILPADSRICVRVGEKVGAMDLLGYLPLEK